MAYTVSSTAPLGLLSIQSWVCYGHVGNAAALFPLQRLGAEVITINTVQFSNHTGYGHWAGTLLQGEDVVALLEGIDQRGALNHLNGVLSGYMGSPEIGQAVLHGVEKTKKANPDALYCCDPVIGDMGRGVYVREGVAEFFSQSALPAADILTPNLFEVQMLTGISSITSMDQLRMAIESLQQKMNPSGPAIVMVTSVKLDDTPHNSLDVIAADRTTLMRVRTPLLDLTPTGTGDLTAALFFFHILKEKNTGLALSKAISSVWGVLSLTAHLKAAELQIVAGQREIVEPQYFYKAEKINR